MRNEDGEVEQENALINRTYVNVKCQIMKKYGQDPSTWLSSLTSSQLDKIVELILTCDTFEELKQQIQNNE